VSADWLMYVAECSDGSYYTGITTDMTRRLNEHNRTKRGAKYTRSRRPVRLIYFESHENRSEASRAEAAFKKLTRKKKEAYIDWN
jgi:putative endonuclease